MPNKNSHTSLDIPETAEYAVTKGNENNYTHSSTKIGDSATDGNIGKLLEDGKPYKKILRAHIING